MTTKTLSADNISEILKLQQSMLDCINVNKSNFFKYSKCCDKDGTNIMNIINEYKSFWGANTDVFENTIMNIAYTQISNNHKIIMNDPWFKNMITVGHGALFFIGLIIIFLIIGLAYKYTTSGGSKYPLLLSKNSKKKLNKKMYKLLTR